ncbi:MAG: N-acetylmuramoyl-L-alanine amidase [Bryobacterales bacterium]|nr:N-acetylmuramoyl-L-alanine amidase [Bryobacterales bacterium]
MSSASIRSRAARAGLFAGQRPIHEITNNCNHLEADCPRSVDPRFGPGAVMPEAAHQKKAGIAADAGNRRSQELQTNSFRLLPNQYLPQRHRKDLIVLHFTAGTSCESAYRTWAGNPERIATAFGVDPDGSVVEFFPPECWAYHLGVKGTHRHDQRSIGIEIANVGPLKLAPDNPAQLNWWPGNWGTRYCRAEEQEQYLRCRYRGIDFFATMPAIQQQAVGTLVGRLCDEFSIPRVASLAARRGEFDPRAFDSYSGVATHTNFRRDKWDVGPAFHWDHLGF